jgi:hypothetical protein
MAVRHSTHAMTRCLCEWWKYRAKTLARGGVGAGASIARRIYRIVWLRVGIAVSVAECFCGLGTGVLIVCLCYLPPASAPTATPRLTPTSLNLVRFPLCLYLRPRYARACPFPADLARGPAFDRRSVADRSHPGRPLWGRAPRWNIKTDLTPRAAATISRVRVGFRC